MSADGIPDVALVAPYPKPGVRHGGSSGVASYTANLAHALSDRGAAVTVISPQEPGEPSRSRDGSVDVVRGFVKGPGALPAALRAARATRSPVVHLQHELFLYGGPSTLPGLVAGLGTGRVRRESRPRQVVTMHQVVDPARVDSAFTELHRIPVRPRLARTAIAAVQRSIRSLADLVIVHEPSFTGVIPGAVTVPHGVEPGAPVDRAAARRALGFGDELVALCFGFVAPYKGLELACDAARLAGDGVQLVIAGGHHPRLESAHGYAAALRREYGDVARFTGFVPDADVAQWFRAADVVLLTYPAPHASSGALALAIAHGTPVLASAALARTCGLPEGAVVADSADLGRRLRMLAENRGGLAELSDAVRSLREDRGWDSVADRHLDLYRDAA